MVGSFTASDGQRLLALLEEAIDFAVYQVAVDPSAPYGGRVWMVSPALKTITGIADPLCFESWFANIHPDDLPRVLEANRRSWSEGTRYNETARFYNQQQGRWVWAQTVSTPVFDEAGRLTHFTGLVVDITEQKQANDALEQRVAERTRELEQANAALRQEAEQRRRAEESLQISQALYSEVFDNSPLQIFVQEVLPGGRFRVLRTNPAHQRGSGMPPEAIWGKTVEELVIPEVARSVNQHYRDCIAAGRPIEYEETGPSPYWDLDRIRTYRTTIAPVYDDSGRVVRLVGASQDITEQKQAEQILMERAREEAVSAERSRLARELHDAVTQTLFSTTLIAEVLPKIWERSPEEGRRKLDELRILTRGALAEMRTLLVELRPDALAEASLDDLLRHLVNAFIARSRIPTRLDLQGACDLPLDVKIAFYRVAQEALNNAARHSEAAQVTVTLSGCPAVTTLAIADDGLGFDLHQAQKPDHYGLRILRERAAEIRAALRVDTHPGRGTRITLRWPEDGH